MIDLHSLLLKQLPSISFGKKNQVNIGLSIVVCVYSEVAFCFEGLHSNWFITLNSKGITYEKTLL